MTDVYRITKVLWPDHFAGPKYCHMAQGRTGSWEYKYESPLNLGSWGGTFNFNDGQEPSSIYFISCLCEEIDEKKTPKSMGSKKKRLPKVRSTV